MTKKDLDRRIVGNNTKLNQILKQFVAIQQVYNR